MMRQDAQERIFDTLVDTNKLYVSIKANFTLREYTNQDGKTPVILSVTGNRQRERISTDIAVDTKHWLRDKQRLSPINQYNLDINLVLDNIMAKITAIKTSYRLGERSLTPAVLKKELLSGMPRVQFPAFFKMCLEEEKSSMTLGTYKRHRAVLEKITTFQPDLTFMDIDNDWIRKYRLHLAKLGNQKTTIAANIASIKKFLNLAVKSGIKLRLNLDDVKPGSTKGNRTFLTPPEVKKLLEYYYSNHINKSYQLVLGYFLFSCMTGLRISDVQNLQRKNLLDGYVNFISQKTQTHQTINLNSTALRIVEYREDLFVTKFADQHINDELKKICNVVGITKHVTFHVGRHTFATSFLRAGGNVENLQKLLGHSSISQTMIYVHILQEDANAEMNLLDELYK